MRTPTKGSAVPCLLLLVLLCADTLTSQCWAVGAKSRKAAKTAKYDLGSYGPGFYNHSGCLYAHIGDLSHFEMITADEFHINETLSLEALSFDVTRSKCSGIKQPGRLSFSFKIPDNKRVGSIAITLKITPIDTSGYWEVSQANLTVTRADIERKRTFPLRVSGVYAGAGYSYSCGQLSMTTKVQPRRQQRLLDDDREATTNSRGADPVATVRLARFQLQPFEELRKHVFAASYDCSQWLTLPGFMGLVLILLMTVVTVVGISLLKGIETNDFKFSREGLMYTKAWTEANKQR